MTRTKAALSHFFISLTIFMGVVLVLLFFWYPSPHFNAAGGWQGLKIVASVDLVLGPLLTLIIFNTKKPRRYLILDLSIIAIMQLGAFSWGINAIYQQRPVALVFWAGEFLSVPAATLKERGIELSELDQYGEQSPILIYAQRPETLPEITRVQELINSQLIPPHEQIELYRPLAENFASMETEQININEVIEANAVMKNDLLATLAKTNAQIEDYQYYPLRSKYLNIILLFNHNGELENHILVPLAN